MPTSRTTLLSLLLLGSLAAPALAGEPLRRQYPIRPLEPDAAEAIAWSICQEGGSPCEVINVGPTFIAVNADAPTQARVSAALAAARQVPAAQVFQVTIVEAMNNGDRGLGDVPEPARAALDDARTFLPFNGYSLLGTAVMRTNDSASAMVPGPGTRELSCDLRFENSVTREGREIVLRRFSLSRMPPRTSDGSYVEGASAVQILDTSFGMKPGETVVVGTSKIEGADKALVVLLTAIE